MLIGELSMRSGIRRETIRFYERLGLIDTALRRENGYRDYSPDCLQQIETLHRLKELGFTLKEVDSFLKSQTDAATACHQSASTLQRRIENVDQRIQELQELRDSLEQQKQQCTASRPSSSKGCHLLGGQC